MKMVLFKANDVQVKMPNHQEKNLRDIKENYISETLTGDDVEDLFDLIDFLLNRIIDSESERFRSNY